MIRDMTTREVEHLEITRIMCNAFGQNARLCTNCGNVENFPNSDSIMNCVFQWPNCQACREQEKANG